MKTDPGYDAVLHHWCVLGYRSPVDEVQVIVGRITGDRKLRFADGRWIMTSMLVSPPDQVGEGKIARTLNSRYLLGEPLDTGVDGSRTRR